MTDREVLKAAVLKALPIDPDDGTVVIGYGKDGFPLWSYPDGLAAAITDAVMSVTDEAETERRVRAKVLSELEVYFRSCEWPKSIWKADVRRIVGGTDKAVADA